MARAQNIKGQKREKEQGLDMESFVSHALESGLHPEENAGATGKP